jgi:diguanylate cyclase (GGDEF)-like protein/PAS domain S-box-containing protein
MRKSSRPVDVSARGDKPRDDAAQLRLIADNMPAMSSAYDEKLHCLFANRRFAEFFGFTTAGIVGQHLRGIIGEAPYKEVRPHFERVLNGHRATYSRTRVLKNGESRYLEVELIPHVAADGRIRGVFAVTSDVTERRREEQLRILGDSTASLIADAKTSRAAIEAVIRAICESERWECGVYFRPSAEAPGLRLTEAWGTADAAIQKFLERSKNIDYAPGVGLIGQVWQSGQALWVPDLSKEPRALRRAYLAELGLRGAFVFPVRSQGAVIGVFAFNSRESRAPDEQLLQAILNMGSQIGQVLERKRAEEQLRESEARFRALTELSSDWYWEQDEQLRFRRLAGRGAAANARGGDPSVYVGKARWEIPDLAPVEGDWEAHRRQLMRHEPFRDLELRRQMDDGSVRYMSITGEPTVDAGGRFAGYRGVGRDITLQKRAEDESRRFRLAMDSSADMMGLVDRATMKFVDVNTTLCALVGYTREELLGMRLDDLLPVSREQLAAAYDKQITNPSVPGGMKSYYRCKDGSHLPFESRRQVIRSGDNWLISVVSRDIRERIQAETALRESEARFRSLTALSSDVFWEQDAQFRFTALADAAGRIDATEVLGKTRWEQDYTNLSAEDWAAHKTLLEAHLAFRDLELCRKDRSGTELWYSVSGEPVIDAAGTFTGYRGVGRDITPHKVDEGRIRYLADHDVLTGLPNRTSFNVILNAARENARRQGNSLAVMFVDLDRFKLINDTLGHDAGDQLLCEMGVRLRDTLRASDVVARLGGDEFVVLIQEVKHAGQVEAVARKILAALGKPMLILGRECTVTASIGICLYPRDADDPQSLMKNADTAMYRTKESGKNNYQFYSEALNSNSLERLAMETSLRRGLQRDEFFLHYQPRVDLGSGTVTGVEALIRWKHPQLGIVPPAKFIPIAEESGAIVELGRWVLDTACAQAAAWQKQGLAALRMAVNISARQFANQDLVKQIAEALQQSGLAAQWLEVELTESVVAQNLQRAAIVLSQIRGFGARLALDDFGTGYSSLAQLKRFPIQTLKVDRSFVSGLPHDKDDAAITQAIIAMGRSLGLVVIAEGVETEAQKQFLSRHGCKEMQGFLFSRPLPAEECAAFLRSRSAVSRAVTY